MSQLHNIEKGEGTPLSRSASIKSEDEKSNSCTLGEGTTDYTESKHEEVEELEKAGDMGNLELQHVCMLYSIRLDSR